MIKAVIFDAGGVLLAHPLPGMLEYCTRHLQVSEEQFLAAYSTLETDWQTGRISEEEFWEQMCHALKAKRPDVVSLWFDGFKYAYQENDEVFALANLLKQQGYKTGLLSNTEVPVMHFLNERMKDYFDLFVYSCAVGLCKPEKAIYEHTIQQLDIKPEEAVFIDDRADNIEGAREIGMHGILFTENTCLKRDLQALGLAF